MPSHLISKSQLGSGNGFSPSLGRVTETSLGIGAERAPGKSAGFGAAESRVDLFSFFVLARGRPLTTDSPCSSTLHIGSACSSRCLISSHSFLPRLCLSFTSTKLPFSL